MAKNSKKTIKILVYVRGGNVQGISSTDPHVQVEMFDVDNLRDSMTGDEIDKLHQETIKKYPHGIY